MLLTIDVGNTNTLFGIFADGGDTPIVTVRASSRRDRMPDEWYAILEPGLRRHGLSTTAISGIVISSVVPGVTAWLRWMGTEIVGVETVVITAGLDLGIVIATAVPAEVGTDRIANSIAARDRYGTPAIVIDFGTATNFDVVNGDGAFVGGALAPGLAVALDALASRAARLFSVELEFPDRALATNTVESLQSGFMFGFLSLIEGLIVRLGAEIEGEPVVVSTGGLGARFAAHSSMIDHHDEHLTLWGLKLAWEHLRHRKP